MYRPEDVVQRGHTYSLEVGSGGYLLLGAALVGKGFCFVLFLPHYQWMRISLPVRPQR